MKEEDNNSFCGISMKPGKTYISKPEKQQSAWELFRELLNKYGVNFLNKEIQVYKGTKYQQLINIEFILTADIDNEQEATKILLEIKQELEK